MRLTLASVATAAMIALTLPAHAQPMNFANQCGPGLFDKPFCYGYVTGFYFALAANGQMCSRGIPSNREMVMVAQKWLRWHSGAPDNFMIRDAMLNAWGCRRR